MPPILTFSFNNIFQYVKLFLVGVNEALVIWCLILFLSFGVFDLFLQIYHSTLIYLLRNFLGSFILFVIFVWNGCILASNEWILASFPSLDTLLFQLYLLDSCHQGFSHGWHLRNISLLIAPTFAREISQPAGPSGHDSGGGKFTIGTFIKLHILCENRRWWIDGLILTIGERFRRRRNHIDIPLLWHLVCANQRWFSDAFIPRDSRLGGGSGGSAFTVKSFSCENFFARIVDGVVMQWCP